MEIPRVAKHWRGAPADGCGWYTRQLRSLGLALADPSDDASFGTGTVPHTSMAEAALSSTSSTGKGARRTKPMTCAKSQPLAAGSTDKYDRSEPSLWEADARAVRTSCSGSTAKRAQTFRYLLLTSTKMYRTWMHRWEFHFAEGASMNKGWAVLHWGPGFPRWVPTETVTQNLEREFPDCAFDLLWEGIMWSSKGMSGTEKRDLFVKHKTVIASQEHETTESRYRRGKFTLLFQAYSATRNYGLGLLEMQNISARKRGMPAIPNAVWLQRLPHGVTPRFFNTPTAPLALKERNRSALIVGNLVHDLYPLRDGLHRCVGKCPACINGRLGNGRESAKCMANGCTECNSGMWTHTFPGYAHKTATFKEMDGQVYNYAAQLKRSRVCLIGGSVTLDKGFRYYAERWGRDRWTFNKYMEAMVAKCVMVGEVPDDQDIAPFVVPIDGRMSVHDIEAVVQRVLDAPEKFQPLVDRAHAVAIKFYSHQALARDIIGPSVRARQAGKCPGATPGSRLSCNTKAAPIAEAAQLVVEARLLKYLLEFVLNPRRPSRRKHVGKILLAGAVRDYTFHAGTNTASNKLTNIMVLNRLLDYIALWDQDRAPPPWLSPDLEQPKACPRRGTQRTQRPPVWLENAKSLEEASPPYKYKAKRVRIRWLEV